MIYQNYRHCERFLFLIAHEEIFHFQFLNSQPYLNRILFGPLYFIYVLARFSIFLIGHSSQSEGHFTSSMWLDTYVLNCCVLGRGGKGNKILHVYVCMCSCLYVCVCICIHYITHYTKNTAASCIFCQCCEETCRSFKAFCISFFHFSF